MGKVRRGGYVFLTWKGDHRPKHVHVYKSGRLVLKWNLEEDRLMHGTASRALLDALRELQKKGQL